MEEFKRDYSSQGLLLLHLWTQMHNAPLPLMMSLELSLKDVGRKGLRKDAVGLHYGVFQCCCCCCFLDQEP